MADFPRNLQGVLWSRDISNLDIKNSRHYIVHQILAYGTWEHLKWLFATYKTSEIKTEFLKFPEKDYTNRSFSFIKKVILDLKGIGVDEKSYVRTYPRIIR